MAGSVANPIRTMEDEHYKAAADLWLLRRLTNDYAPPEHACATWHACYEALDAFEHDLQQHVHLENNVLFPAALRLEEGRPSLDPRLRNARGACRHRRRPSRR